jgi:hypothetical protein
MMYEIRKEIHVERNGNRGHMLLQPVLAASAIPAARAGRFAALFFLDAAFTPSTRRLTVFCITPMSSRRVIVTSTSSGSPKASVSFL